MRVLTGGYNRYKYEVYENGKTENLVDLTLIIKSEFALNSELDTVLINVKNRILEHYNKKIRYKETETIKLSIAKYQGIAKYNILLKN